MPAPAGAYLRDARRGGVPLGEVVAALDDSDAEPLRLHARAELPPGPDRAWVDGWLHRSHLAYWAAREAGSAVRRLPSDRTAPPGAPGCEDRPTTTSEGR